MADEKKITKGIQHKQFVDEKGNVKIHCTRICTCEPPQTLKDIEEENGFVGTTYRYEVKDWHLKEDINEMLYEGDEYEGEVIDAGDWESIICEKYKLTPNDLKTEYHWQDSTITFSEKE